MPSVIYIFKFYSSWKLFDFIYNLFINRIQFNIYSSKGNLIFLNFYYLKKFGSTKFFFKLWGCQTLLFNIVQQYYKVLPNHIDLIRSPHVYKKSMAQFKLGSKVLTWQLKLKGWCSFIWCFWPFVKKVWLPFFYKMKITRLVFTISEKKLYYIQWN